MWSFLHGGEPYEVVERDDAFISAAESTAGYFASFKSWPSRQQLALTLARGRTLDVGCGAGKVSLYLQKRGLRVTGIDNSPLAIQTCRKRGVKDARVLSFEDVRDLRPTTFDTVVMFGNNFGLFGSFTKAQRLLKQLHRMTNDNAVILAETLNPFETNHPAHLKYLRKNRQRGRMPGQIRIRVRFQDVVGPWFDYLLVSPNEMRDILRGTGWTLKHIIRDTSPRSIAILEKE